LDNLSDYRDYLSKSDHGWTTVGKTISESPILARSDYKVFLAVLPNIYYLSSVEISRANNFYNHHQQCEQLIEILFGRVQQQRQTEKPLTEDQVNLTKNRIRRILLGVDQVLKVTGKRIYDLSDLPRRLVLPSSGDITGPGNANGLPNLDSEPAERCSRCGVELDPDREGSTCQSCVVGLSALILFGVLGLFFSLRYVFTVF
jgi:hypothetical protein